MMSSLHCVVQVGSTDSRSPTKGQQEARQQPASATSGTKGLTECVIEAQHTHTACLKVDVCARQ